MKLLSLAVCRVVLGIQKHGYFHTEAWNQPPAPCPNLRHTVAASTAVKDLSQVVREC